MREQRHKMKQVVVETKELYAPVLSIVITERFIVTFSNQFAKKSQFFLTKESQLTSQPIIHTLHCVLKKKQKRNGMMNNRKMHSLLNDYCKCRCYGLKMTAECCCEL